MKLRKRIMALALGILGSVTVLGTAAFAATESQAGTGGQKSKTPELAISQQDAKLTVEAFTGEGKNKKPVEKDGKGLRVSLYKIAEMDENGNYTLVGDLKDAINAEDLKTYRDIADTQKNADIRHAISQYMYEKGIDTFTTPYSKETENGTAVFDLPQGLYYLQGDIIEDYFPSSVSGHPWKYSYIPTTSLVNLPMDAKTDKGEHYWDYVPIVNVKYRMGGVWIDPPVLKVIEAKENEAVPESNFIFVLEPIGDAPIPDEKLKDITYIPEKENTNARLEMLFRFDKAERVTDTTDSEGRHKVLQRGTPREFGRIWYEKPGLYEYYIYEVPYGIGGYIYDPVLYKLHVRVYLTANGYLTGEQWFDKFPDGKDPNPGPSKELVIPKKTYSMGSSAQSGFEPLLIWNKYEKPDDDRRRGGGGGGGSSVIRRATPSSAAPTTAPEEPEVIPGMLPKTGMLWWPVPILAVAGIFLLAAGFILERRRS